VSLKMVIPALHNVIFAECETEREHRVGRPRSRASTVVGWGAIAGTWVSTSPGPIVNVKNVTSVRAFFICLTNCYWRKGEQRGI
jgi:hypothetical protein